jgi:hypothetical protein
VWGRQCARQYAACFHDEHALKSHLRRVAPTLRNAAVAVDSVADGEHVESLNPLEETVMGNEDPRHPQPDDLPEHERTGSEPNPSGHPPRERPPPHPASAPPSPADPHR